MSRFKSLKEFVFGSPKVPAEINQGTAIVGQIEQSSGITITTSFKDQVAVFNSDPVLKESINQFAQEVISTGLFTTIKDDYKLILSGKDAKMLIDSWNRSNDVDNRILQCSTELVAFGNSIWQITDNGFVNVPIESIYKALAVDKTTPIREKYNLQLIAAYGSKILQSETFIHFKSGMIGNGVFGSGVILGLIAEPDDNTPSLWTIRKSVRAAMKEGFAKFSFGNELWSFEGMSDEKIEEIGEKIADMDSTGQRIATNVKGDIRLAVPQRTQSYDKWIEQIDKEFYSSLIMGITPDTQFTTKATAEALRDQFMMRVASMRRIIKRGFETLYIQILNKSGYEGELADPKLHFGSQDIAYATTDIFAAVDKSIISKEEARTILMEYMKWRLTGKAPPEPVKSEPAVPVPPVPTKEEVEVKLLRMKKKELIEALLKKVES